MPQYQQPFTLAGYGMGDEPTRGEQRRAPAEGRFEIGGFSIRDPETIDDPALRDLAIRYRDAQTTGQDTSELRRLMAARVAELLRERATATLLNPADLALWSLLGGVGMTLVSKLTGWKPFNHPFITGVGIGASARIVKGMPAYAGGRLAATVIGGAADAQTTPEVQVADQAAEAIGRWR